MANHSLSIFVVPLAKQTGKCRDSDTPSQQINERISISRIGFGVRYDIIHSYQLTTRDNHWKRFRPLH